jgi:hypothetical protein
LQLVSSSLVHLPTVMQPSQLWLPSFSLFLYWFCVVEISHQETFGILPSLICYDICPS